MISDLKSYDSIQDRISDLKVNNRERTGTRSTEMSDFLRLVTNYLKIYTCNFDFTFIKFKPSIQLVANMEVTRPISVDYRRFKLEHKRTQIEMLKLVYRQMKVRGFVVAYKTEQIGPDPEKDIIPIEFNCYDVVTENKFFINREKFDKWAKLEFPHIGR